MAEKTLRKLSKKKRIIITVTIAVILVLGAAVGGWLYVNRFDAGEYVQAVLDTSYKNETDQYVEITGIPKEDAEKIFENNLNATMAGFEDSEMPEELRPQYRELFGEIAGKVSYTVDEPKREKDGSYTVTVMIKPITLFPDTYELFQTRAQEYASQVTDSVMNGAEMPSDEEMQSQIYQIYYDVLKERVDSGMLYGGARELTLHVTKEGSREFTINQEDMDALDSALIEDAETPEGED
nr:hypothetical protein [uncultured Mediterraneibacter sp.]